MEKILGVIQLHNTHNSISPIEKLHIPLKSEVVLKKMTCLKHRKTTFQSNEKFYNGRPLISYAISLEGINHLVGRTQFLYPACRSLPHLTVEYGPLGLEKRQASMMFMQMHKMLEGSKLTLSRHIAHALGLSKILQKIYNSQQLYTKSSMNRRHQNTINKSRNFQKQRLVNNLQ